MTVSEYIASALAENKVPAVFELVGGMIVPLLDALYLRNEVPIVSMRHEQGAAFAAEGSARITGMPGVAMATSGPGATNLITGIASCYFDSTPAVFITGQVNRHEQRGARAIRQLGFQEADVVSMATPVTKRAWSIREAVDVPGILQQAFDLAAAGRKGPVLLDIPMDVQRVEIGEPQPKPFATSPAPALNETDANRIADAFARACKPLILAGGGIRSAHAVATFRDLTRIAGVPVVNSLMGVDVLPWGDPLRVGMIGSYGNRWANLALADCDCLLVLGSRLDIRQTGADIKAFQEDREIFHIDCEPGEINNRLSDCIGIESDLYSAIRLLVEVMRDRSVRSRDRFLPWLRHIGSLRERWPDIAELDIRDAINPNVFMHALARAFPAAGAFSVDVGQHQMWAAQSLELNGNQRFLTSGGLGSMGFALPAAIGAAVSLPGGHVVVIAGDGGFQCNIQELQTVAHLGLPLKMAVVNNQCHGMVRQFQESYFASRYQSTVWGYSAPDFQKIACAYGIPARTVQDPLQLDAALAWFAEDLSSPALLQVMVPPEANAWPKLAFGRGLKYMEPHSAPLDISSE